MSKTRKTQDTNRSTSDDLLQEPIKVMKTDYEPEVKANVMALEDLDDLSPTSQAELKQHQKIQYELMKIDQRIQLALLQKKVLSADEDVIEVSEDILKHFNNGKLPTSHYVIFKNVKSLEVFGYLLGNGEEDGSSETEKGNGKTKAIPKP